MGDNEKKKMWERLSDVMFCFAFIYLFIYFFLTNIDGFKLKCHKHVYGQKCEHVYICAPSSIL